MSYGRFLLLALLGCQFPAMAAQEGRVTIANASSKELKRSALRMRVPVERLKNMREALQRATDLSRRLDPPSPSLGYVGQLWIQINRPGAKATIEDLIEDVRRQAESAKVISAYDQYSSSYSSLLLALEEVDADRAAEEGRHFPQPSQALGEGGEKQRSQQAEQFERQLLGRLTYQDPVKAANLYSEFGPFTGTDYTLRSQIAQQLFYAGDKDQAYTLLDGAIADFGKRTPDQANYQDYVGFLQQVASIDPERFTNGLDLVMGATGEHVSGGSGTWTLQMGDKSLSLSFDESQMLNLMRAGFYNHPGLLISTLDRFPDLKAKLDEVGGIDSVMNPGPTGLSMSYSSSSGVGSIGSGVSVRSSAPPVDKVSALFRQLKGKATTNPAGVRDKLSETCNKPEDAETLINLAQRAAYEDPDLASIVLKTAEPLVMQEQPLEKRSYLLQNFVRVYRSCEGEIDASLLKEGFVVADQLRQDANDKGITFQPGSSPADQLEQTMLSEYASDHYEEAMRYLQSMPDDEAKVTTLLRIVETLRQNY